MNIAPLQIASIPLATNLLVAPLAGYTDLPFRLIARRLGGVGLACTDLLSPHAMVRHTRKTLELISTCPEDSPLAMQIFGGEAKIMCDAARWAEDHGAHILDINMGCPVARITRQAGGSALLCDPESTLRLVEKVQAVLRHIPLTAKLRLGWDDQHIVAPYLASRLEQLGVAAITIHGRTRQMQFAGPCRLEGIAQVVAAVKAIPVIGNGDVRTPQDARRMLEQTGCHGIMIGRAALSSPWIFRDTWSYLTTGTIPPEPTLEEKCRFIREHFHGLIQQRNEKAALCEFRSRISWYAKRLHPCQQFRQSMRLVRSAAEFDRILDEFLQWRLTAC